MTHPCINCKRWIGKNLLCMFYGYNVGDKVLLTYGDVEVAHAITDEDMVCPLTDNIKQLQNKLANETLAKDGVMRAFQLIAEENAALRNMMNQLVNAIFALNSAQDFSQARKLNDNLNAILAGYERVK